MKLRSIVVDDSSMQRMAVAKLVNNHPNLALVADYSNAIEAKNGIKNNEIDLIFLDVEMPIISGFDLLESLENSPQVILITGKPDYALKAFDYDAKDKEWVDGTIYDPKNGKTYKCFIWFEEDDDITLHVKGFIGFALLGREVEWKREENLRE